MRQQVEERTGQKVEQHLIDGGDMRKHDIEQAGAQGVQAVGAAQERQIAA